MKKLYKKLMKTSALICLLILTLPLTLLETPPSRAWQFLEIREIFVECFPAFMAMFLFNLCEKRGSGMDRAVAGIEAMRLPAITIERGEDFTRARLFPLKKYTEMTRAEKVQACYQHACLLYENGFELTNQSLRERLGMPKNNSAGASRIIADAVEAGLIHLSDKAPDSKKYSSYVPYYV